MEATPNIERSAFHSGAHVGYGGGAVWTITRGTGEWIAIPRQSDAPAGVKHLRLRAKTLPLLSKALENVGEPAKQTGRPFADVARAKIGDLVAVGSTRSFKLVHGPSHSTPLWRVYWVTGVRRDGVAQRYKTILTGGAVAPGPFRDQVLIAAATVDVAALAEAIKARGDDDFESLDDLRTMAQQFKRPAATGTR